MIGDGKCEPVTISGDRLRNMDKLVEIGTNVPLPSAVENTKDNLSKKVFEYVTPRPALMFPCNLHFWVCSVSFWIISSMVLSAIQDQKQE